MPAARLAAQTHAVTLTPEPVVVGAPELIRIEAPDAQSVSGQWLGAAIMFFPSASHTTWYALAGVDVEATAGPTMLHILVRTAQGEKTVDRDVLVAAAHYRTAKLTVAPKFVEPGPDELRSIEADRALKEKVFAASALEQLWRGSFRAPVQAAATDSFGTRRTFNGTLASTHKGMDYRARTGTLVRAANSGMVVLARRLYYEGNCVVIDHGLGLYTLSMHLSRLDVHEGERVAAGQRLGLSGSTGRVTGPHLHFAVRWQGAYLDPAKLLRLSLNAIR